MRHAVHRIIEQRASLTPDAAAIVDGQRVVTYRELNQWANALARRLMASGLRRGSLACVAMPRGAELAVVLLAIVKAGACYTWSEPASGDDSDSPSGFSILWRSHATEDRYLALDLAGALRESCSGSAPNLPVVTRGADIACVVTDAAGRPSMLVPHATIAALPRTGAGRQQWGTTAGALDLWMALMSGATVSVATAPAAAAA